MQFIRVTQLESVGSSGDTSTKRAIKFERTLRTSTFVSLIDSVSPCVLSLSVDK